MPQCRTKDCQCLSAFAAEITGFTARLQQCSEWICTLEKKAFPKSSSMSTGSVQKLGAAMGEGQRQPFPLSVLCEMMTGMGIEDGLDGSAYSFKRKANKSIR